MNKRLLMFMCYSMMREFNAVGEDMVDKIDQLVYPEDDIDVDVIEDFGLTVATPEMVRPMQEYVMEMYQLSLTAEQYLVLLASI